MGDTKATVQGLCDSVNARFESHGSIYRYEIGYRYGYCAIDRYTGAQCHSHVTAGTKTEMADWLRAAGTALDDSDYANLIGG